VISIFISASLATSLFVVFKLFQKWNVNTWQALLVNYITACFLGILYSENAEDLFRSYEKPWFLSSLIMGTLFISIFYAVGKTAQIHGLSVAAITTKMSVIIPVIAGIILYNERLQMIQITGIIIALISVYLSTKKEAGGLQLKSVGLPILVFVGTGSIDTAVKWVQEHFLKDGELTLFSAHTFGVAFLVGLCVWIIQQTKKVTRFEFKSVLGGLLLGIPNFFSLIWMIKMLEQSVWSSAITFTIHNILIVVGGTLIGAFLFKEKLNRKNIYGLLLAVIALGLMAF
jgi:drug/metabolite transporter (DMT)-like permease